MMRKCLWSAAIVFSVACGSFIDLGPAFMPTTTKPAIACIAPTFTDQARTEAKPLPRIVRVIGLYRDSDGFPILDANGKRQWMTLQNGEQDPAKWVPRSDLKFIGCGQEADAFRDVEQREPAPIQHQ